MHTTPSNHPQRRRGRTLLAALALTALAAACSTTNDDDTSATTAASESSVHDTATSDSAAVDTTVVETTEPAAENGPGVSDDEIVIGVETNEKSQAAQDATTGVQVREVGAQVQILVDAINDDGGINGRMIKLVKADFDPAAPTEPQENAACNTFTKDNQVFAVLGLRTDASEAYLACLADAGSLFIAGSPTQPVDQQLLDAASNLWAPQTMLLDEFAAAYVATLAEQGFFEGATLGVVVSADNPIFQRVYESALLPALEAAGVTPAHVASVPDSFETAMEVVPTELLKMQEAGVNKVLALEPNGIGIGVTVLLGASQGLIVLPAMSTFDTPEPVRATLPPGSLAGVVGLAFGSPVEENQVPNLNAAATECLDVLVAAGEEITDGNARGVSFVSCANVSFLRDVLAAIDGTVNSDTFAIAAQSLGGDYQSAWGSLDLSTGERTGQHLLQPFTLNAACDCFEYSTDLVETRG